jgi:hypothetical protein
VLDLLQKELCEALWMVVLSLFCGEFLFGFAVSLALFIPNKVHRIRHMLNSSGSCCCDPTMTTKDENGEPSEEHVHGERIDGIRKKSK